MTSPPVSPAIKQALSEMEPAMMISCIWILLAAMVEKSVTAERDRCDGLVEHYNGGGEIDSTARSEIRRQIQNPFSI